MRKTLSQDDACMQSWNEPLITERVALLKYYNSQCVGHGAYVIALVVGASVLISRWDVFSPTLLTFLFFSAITIGIVIILAYAIGRSFYWGGLATKVMQVNLNNPVDKEEEELVRIMQEKNEPPMFMLHKVTHKRESPLLVLQ